MKSKMSEKGFTLIELVVGIAIAAVIVGAASMTVVTMMRLSPQSNNWAIALHQVQNAGQWISQDVQMSQGNIDIDPAPDTFLTLTLPQDQNPDNNKTIVYEFEDINGEQWLVRTDSIEGQTAIAQFISNTTAAYSSDNYTLTFTIEAILGDTDINRADVQRQYEAMQRVPPAPAP